MRSREKHQSRQASQELSTADLKALHAHPDAIVPDADRDDNHKRGKRRLGHMGVAGLVAGVTVTSVFVGSKVLGGNNDSAERNTTENPVATASATPGTSEAPSSSPEESVPQELTVERYSDGESLAQAWNAELNDWTMANGTLDNLENRDRTITLDEWVDQINEPVDEAYVDTLFVSDWQNRPQLSTIIGDFESNHHVSVATNLMTSGGYNDADVEPYKQEWKLTSVNEVSSSQDEMVVDYRYVRIDNADQNRGGSIMRDGSVDGITGGGTITFENVDGVWKISDIKY